MRRISFRAIVLTLVAMVSSPVLAEWRDEIGALRIGAVSERGVSASLARLEPFRLAIAEKLDTDVELFPARDYPILIDALADGRLDYAVLSAVAYAAAYNLCECVEPLVIAANGAGQTAFRQIVLTRSDRPASLQALAGGTLAVIGASVAGGTSMALASLERQGLTLGTGGVELREFDSGEDALNALADRSVTALLGWEGVAPPGSSQDTPLRGTLRRITAREGSLADYRIIWRSQPIPHRVHAIRSGLPGGAKTLLRSALTTMFEADPIAYDSVESDFGGGFIAARQSQFSALTEYLASQGIRPSGSSTDGEADPIGVDGADKDQSDNREAGSAEGEAGTQ